MPKVSAEHLESRKRQILDAAMECFAAKGFHQTTMKDIFVASGLSAGAVYNYFAGKDEIIDAIALDRHARENALLQHGSVGADLAVGLRELAVGFFSGFASDEYRKMRRVGIEVWAEALRNPQVLKTVRRGVDEPVELLSRLVSELQQRGEIDRGVDPEGMARVMVAIFQGFVLQQAWDPGIDAECYLSAVEFLADAVATAGS